jgi:fatty-acyl-CoA synthase
LYEQVTAQICENVYTAYGTSEMMVGTVLFPEEVTEETLGSIGRPVPSLEARVIEPDSRDPDAEVEDGEDGELIVRGPMVSNDLWDNPEKERSIFHEEGWFFTGDLAVVEEEYIYLKGRADNMIISGGINIYAENVEHTLEKHPEVYEAAVVGVPHEKWGEAVKAFVVTSGQLTGDDLEEWCVENDELADYQRPREYEFREKLPRTNTGKKNRSALRDREMK